jgi:hypothetical protein
MYAMDDNSPIALVEGSDHESAGMLERADAERSVTRRIVTSSKSCRFNGQPERCSTVWPIAGQRPHLNGAYCLGRVYP